MDYVTLHQAYLAFMRERGRAEAYKLIRRVGHAETLDKVAEKHRPALVTTFQKVTPRGDHAKLYEAAYANLNRRRS